MADRSISIAIEAKVSGFVAGMKTAQKSAEDFGDRTAKFAAENEQHLDRVGKASMVMGGLLLAGFGLAVKSFMEFESALAEVRASTHETAGNMDLLREAAINAGADTAFSAAEAAKGIDELAKAGVSTTDILNGGLAGALSLAAAGSLGVGDAAELAATALTQFKLSGKDIPHLADLLAAGAGKAQGSVEDIGNALKQSGLVASQFGLSIEDTTGTLAAFASAGLVGSDAGTSLKTMLLKLASPSKEAAGMMSELGIAAYNSSGKFVGVTNLAGQLKDKLGGLTQAQRDSTLATIFGTDAIRGANVLYESGADGITGWIDKVNEAGYAAVTASIKQDTLAGDLEKLGGSFDSVLIKGGSGAAQSLRGIVQGAEDLVDAIGKIPAPILNMGVGIAGIAGGALLLGGGLMTALPRIMEFRTSMSDLADASPRAAAGIGKVAKAAGLAAAAMVALQVVSAVFTEKDVKSAEDYGQAMLKVAKASGAAGSDSGLNSLFETWDKFAGEGPDIRDLAGAVKEVVNPHIPAGIQDTLDGLFSWTGGAKNDLGQVRDRFKGLGEEMGNLAKNGAADTAAKSFQALTAEFEKNGKGQKEALESVPGYRDALNGLANQAGVTLSEQDLLDFAMGKVPASMNAAKDAVETYTSQAGAAAPITEDMAKALEEVGLSAQGAITDIDAFGKSLFAAGLLSLSASDASIAYQDSIDKMTASVVKNGTTLDINTEAGRANQSAFNGLAQAAMASAEASATETLATQGSAAAQASLQGSLRTSYEDLKTAAKQAGVTGDELDTMARKALGVPKNVNIDAWIADHASATLEGIKGKAESLDGKQVTLTIRENTYRTAYEKRVREADGNEPDGGGLYGSDRGGATGGRVHELMGGLAGGGKVPGRAPSDLSKDNVLALVNGKPFGLQSEEWVINGRSSKDYDRELSMINAGTFPKAGFQYQPAAAPARQVIASTSGAGDVTVYVTNPFTGDEVQGIVRSVARGEVSAGMNNVATMAGGRR